MPVFSFLFLPKDLFSFSRQSRGWKIFLPTQLQKNMPHLHEIQIDQNFKLQKNQSDLTQNKLKPKIGQFQF